MAIVLAISFLVLIFVVLKSRKLNLTSKRMLSLFVGYWAVALVMAAIGITGLNEPSDFTFVLLALNVLMFSMGYLALTKKKKEFSFDHKKLYSIFDKIIESKLFLILLIIAATADIRSSS